MQGVCIWDMWEDLHPKGVCIWGRVCIQRGSASRRDLLNIGYVSNETNTDVHMYIEEFIPVEIWIHYCTKLK